ncbi:MAG: dihydroorotate dehydrogenase, partial [Candidatus Wildermuthbacteria bacterium]|nr:dihydroorotate dehydrogenase [Candidatus Wildermuthbacteria bacterium]
VNSLGLPNPDPQWWKEHLPPLVQRAHQAGKPVWVSVAGFAPIEYARLVLLAIKCGADIVEINLGCPNVWDAGQQKAIASYSPLLTAEILQQVGKVIPPGFPVAAKISPYFLDLLPAHPRVTIAPVSNDPEILQNIVYAIVRSGIVKIVTSGNTVPNARVLKEDGTLAIKSPDVPSGVGGLAGPMIRRAALHQVGILGRLLPPSIDIAAAGGVSTGQDVQEFLDAGAKVVQIGTAFANHGPKVFERILSKFVSMTSQ